MIIIIISGIKITCNTIIIIIMIVISRVGDGGWRMTDKHSGAGTGTQPDGGWRMADDG